MTGIDPNGGQRRPNRGPRSPKTRRRGVGLVAQLRGPTQLTRCDGIPWTLAGQCAAADVQIELWIVVGEMARARRDIGDAADDDPGA